MASDSVHSWGGGGGEFDGVNFKSYVKKKKKKKKKKGQRGDWNFINFMLYYIIIITHNCDRAGLKKIYKPWRKKVGEGCAAYHRTARRETPMTLTPRHLTRPASQEEQGKGGRLAIPKPIGRNRLCPTAPYIVTT